MSESTKMTGRFVVLCATFLFFVLAETLCMVFIEVHPVMMLIMLCLPFPMAGCFCWFENALDLILTKCKVQGHEWQNCITARFQTYDHCERCGERRAVGPNVLEQ